jgi:hypothetical protein
MSSYLVSFTTPGGQYGSHVMEMEEAPLTAEAFEGLQDIMAMEYGTHNAALLSSDLLPDSSTHPGGSGPYSYFLTFSFVSEQSTGFGSASFRCTELICTLADLRFVEERMRSELQTREVHLVSCKAVKEPTPQLMQDSEQWQWFDKPE